MTRARSASPWWPARAASARPPWRSTRRTALRRKFPHGQLYVDLLGATPNPLPVGDVLARFLRDLGVAGRDIPVDDDERAARYRTMLASRRVLVVLDNARDAAQVRPLLPGTASSAVLVTTRSRMPDLASTRLVDLNVLDHDEALALFTRVVGDERSAAEPEATAELLEACAGLPLAIRICAARLATRSGWTIRTMANRLRDVHRRLDELSVGDLAVRASFQVSFASLPGERPAGRHRRRPARSACSACGRDRRSLPRPPPLFSARRSTWPRTRLRSWSTRTYWSPRSPTGISFTTCFVCILPNGPGRICPDQTASPRSPAFSRWYMRTADAAAAAVSPRRFNIPLDVCGDDVPPLSFTTAEDALAWYDSERVNLVAATRQAAGSGLHDIAWRLPTPLFMIFESRGNWADCIATHRIALDSACRAGNRQAQAWVLNNLGDALGVTGHSEGIGHLERSLEIRREIGDRMGEVHAANNLADTYQRLGRAAEALAVLWRVLDLTRQVGDRFGEGVALVNLGSTLLDLDRAEEAIDYLLQARRTFTAIDYADGVGYAMHILGRCYLSLGRDPDALDCLRQAVDSHQAAGNRQRQAATLKSLGIAQNRAGLAAEARASLAHAAAIFAELGDSVQAAEVRAERDVSGIS